uniref:PRELI/MSF1 domain-containing protein n=1 Tax=Syphacia muris TaxID=451379 RepID=A0A0N5AGE3_9BILA
MRIWECPTQFIPYSFDEVVSVFWNRYPNSKANHVISEDVLERKIDGNKIITKKLVVKKGASFLKAAPKWVSKHAKVQIMPTIEESVFDRVTRRLTTYTRNVAWASIFRMHERCVYLPAEVINYNETTPSPCTSVNRAVFVNVNYNAIDSLIERVLVLSFRNSVKKTVAGFMERLEEKYGAPVSGVAFHSGGKISQKAAAIKGKLLHNSKLGFEKSLS